MDKSEQRYLPDYFFLHKAARRFFGILAFAGFLTAPFLLHANSGEDELFGGSASGFSSSSVDEAGLFGSSDDEDALFGSAETGTSLKASLQEKFNEQLQNKESQFHIGGEYYHTVNFTSTEHQSARDTGFASEGIVNLYFDAALDDGVRFYMRQKINYEYSAAQASSTVVNFSGTEAETSIDQMWLKFDYQNSVYVTMGKQPTSWGSGFIWAPTDFVNEEHKSPFSLSDQRLGVSLIKVQYPVDVQGINLYGVLQTDQSNTVGGIRSLVRAEKVFSNSELAGSISSAPHGELKGGVDFSTGLKWFDVYANASFTKHDRNAYYERLPGAGDLTSDDLLGLLQASIDGDPTAIPYNAQLVTLDRSDELIRQLSTGLIYIKSFDDSSQLVVNGEFFYNEKGYEDEDMLTILLLQNPAAFDPLYFSKRYAALGFSRANLGNASHNYGMQYIRNLSDSSGALVLNYGFRPFRDLSFSSNLVMFTGGAGTFNPFAADTQALTETATRVANGELILPPNIQNNLDALPIVLEPQNTTPVTTQVGDNSFASPQFMFLTQFRLRF